MTERYLDLKFKVLKFAQGSRAAEAMLRVYDSIPYEGVLISDLVEMFNSRKEFSEWVIAFQDMTLEMGDECPSLDQSQFQSDVQLWDGAFVVTLPNYELRYAGTAGPSGELPFGEVLVGDGCRMYWDSFKMFEDYIREGRIVQPDRIIQP